MTHDPLACDDPIAARRYAYGRAAADDGDWAAAAEIFEQAAEQAPRWAPAWLALGEAREKLGDVDGARQSVPRGACRGPFRRPGRGGPACAARNGRGAPRFDAHLTEKLEYRSPALIAEALDLAAPGGRSPPPSTAAAAQA